MKINQPPPELTIYPLRWRLVASLVLCLVVFAALCGLMVSILQTNDPGTDTLFAVLLAICTIYLLGFTWSAIRLLTSGQPSLQTNAEHLTLHHLPFLGTVTLPWSEISSLHTFHYLFLSYLCIVHQEPRLLITRYGFLRFALNASSRFSLRTGAPLNISQNLLAQPIEQIAHKLKQNNEDN